MYQITIKGNRKAARIAMQNMIGYGDPDILAEDEENEYSVCFEFTTKYDDDPFHPGFSSPAIWNGEKEDLTRFDDAELAAGNYYLCYNGKGYDGAFLSGLLDLDIEMLQKPDDPDCPFCRFQHFAGGRVLADEQLGRDESMQDAPDVDEEELEKLNLLLETLTKDQLYELLENFYAVDYDNTSIQTLRMSVIRAVTDCAAEESVSPSEKLAADIEEL